MNRLRLFVSNSDYINIKLDGDGTFKNRFEESVSDELSVWFGRTGIAFGVTSWTEPALRFPLDVVDYIYISLVCLMSLIVLVALLACVFNRGLCSPLYVCGCRSVDDGHWFAVLGFALQIYDFFSDLALSAEIWQNANVWNNFQLLISGIGSLVFLGLPYFCNLMFAARIKRRISSNGRAKAWFQKYVSIFVLFVVVTGGCYPALALVSSNVFGCGIFSCGLTQFDLRSFQKIKVVNTIGTIRTSLRA